MSSQTFWGMPKCCRNRTCKATFYYECHKGFIERSELEAVAVMRCLKCQDTFAIIQPISMIHEYKEKLPRSPKTEVGSGESISYEDIRKVRVVLDGNVNPLKNLFEGLRPGTSSPTE